LGAVAHALCLMLQVLHGLQVLRWNFLATHHILVAMRFLHHITWETFSKQ